jgi:hypothetical protein
MVVYVFGRTVITAVAGVLTVPSLFSLAFLALMRRFSVLSSLDAMIRRALLAAVNVLPLCAGAVRIK